MAQATANIEQATKPHAQMASATARRTTQTSRIASRSKQSRTPVDQLAEQLASGLKLSNDKGKQKAVTGHEPEQLRVAAMRAANSASLELSTTLQSGWKKSLGKLLPLGVAASVASAAKHLAILRRISPEDIDIERAAMSVLGKLVSLELYDDALSALEDLHQRLCVFCNVSRPQPTSSSRLYLLSIPIPLSQPLESNATLLTLLSTYLAYSITISVHTTLIAQVSRDEASAFEAFADALSPPETTLLAWIPVLSALSPKQLDPILTRAYSTITKACSSCKSNPRALFLLRIYAVACLGHASSGTMDTDIFWDQIIKFTGSFAKSQESPDDAVTLVLPVFSDMVSRFETMKNSENVLLSGKGFITFCEFWMAFAKKGKDICLVDRIAVLIQRSSENPQSPPSESNNIATQNSTHDENKQGSKKGGDFALEAARLCAAFVQMTTVVEQNDSHIIQRSQDTLQYLQNGPLLCQFIQGQNGKDEELARVGGKVDRALERMRRAVITSLESSFAHSKEEIALALHALLEGIMNVLSPLCNSPLPLLPDILTRILDTLFVLAKTKLHVSDPRTYVPAHEYLVKATSLVEPIQVSDLAVDTPNYVRCISGAFHNLAGTMYQAGRYGNSVGMLKEACRLGVKALEMRRTRLDGQHTDYVEGKTAEAWQQLEEQLWRRWELLGVCYSKIGERKHALGAFTECIRTFPYSTSGFVQRAAKVSPNILFEFSTGTKHLATLIDRVTQLGACDLLLDPSAVSLASLQLDDPSVLGALLERQADSLKTYRCQEGVPRVVSRLLKDAICVYDPLVMPVRRARVLLKCLEFMYHVRSEQVLVGFEEPDKLGKEVGELFQGQNFGKDVHLVPFCAQYQATAHLWLGLHAHRRADSGQSSLLSHHSDEACKILKAAITANVEQKKAPRTSLPKQIVAKKEPAFPPPVSRQRITRKTVVREPVTPKPKGRKALHPVSLNAATLPRPLVDTTKPFVVFDDFEKFLSLLQLTARIAGLLALMLPKVHLLDISRQLCEHQLCVQKDSYIFVSVELAAEYVTLGKTRRADGIFNKLLKTARKCDVSDEIRVLFLLRFAEFLALIEDVPRSSSIYCEALALVERVDFEDKTLPMFDRVQARVKRLERAAIASRVVAWIQYSRDEVTGCIEAMLQSLRLWNRAVDALTRLNSQTPSSTCDAANPFEASKDPTPSELTSDRNEISPSKVYLQKTVTDGLEWRISEGLLLTLFFLGQTYLNRGSIREAEYFVQQAQDLAESLNASTMVSRALAKKAEIQLYQHQFTASLDNLTKAASIVRATPGMDNVDIQRLRGVYNERMARQADANEIYEATLNMIEELDLTFKQFDVLAFGRQSLGASPSNTRKAREVILPQALATVLRRRIWLLRDNVQEYTSLLDIFLSLPHSSRTKAEENALMAKLALHTAYGRLHGDMFLSSLAESTIALPIGLPSGREHKLPASTQGILQTLDAADKFFWENLDLISRRGRVADVRETTVSLALIQAFKTSLGKADECAPTIVAGLLDASSAITLRREMLETIQHKFFSFANDDAQWPVIAQDGSILPKSKIEKTNSRFSFDDISTYDDGSDDGDALRSYWDAVRTRYQSHLLESVRSSQMVGLPSNWTVIHINITEDKNTLFITRQEGRDNDQGMPLIFCVPLKGRRDDGSGDDNGEHLTFESAVNELNDIICLSDQGTRAAIHVKSEDREARAAWWKERGELDTRLRELLENIEFCWLGGFKTILNPRPGLTQDLISGLRSQFEKAFLRSIHVQDKKSKPHAASHKKNASKSQHLSLSQVSFNDALMECFSTLSPKCKDEELEDLVYFILDLYHFHGVPVAIAEVDITQVVVDLRSALENFSLTLSRRKLRPADRVIDEHLFLVLDKDLQSIPWESIPILRGRSVSRIPSVAFLHDRVLFAEWKRKSIGVEVKRPCSGALINPRKGFFILNPSGDLGRTESRFKNWTGEMQGVGWSGIIGQAPSEQQFLNALRDHDLVVYFGHGGAEQYARSHKIRNLSTCAATMLWGCSSGHLKELGDFDRTGTPYNYMLAGCPTLVANLWDVTDGDIDKFSQSVFDKLHLNSESIRQWTMDQQEMSVIAAINGSRDSCKLKYLTGAAPVIYGIPFYL